ncbi:hypothetical protein C8A05DRAFT_46429 [Staphylotrichum tortipilum]|uniref:Aminoglycoside phosphotransferase domain-containing protein n=1 Tax=Staphylotrichum tortipilum TaxID=2831512 RepID=A0AAN6MEQ6_9PEZI|nr:hypothetical protein C8A05DRAFT_46429 [Staphylotrichum longicolle]
MIIWTPRHKTRLAIPQNCWRQVHECVARTNWLELCLHASKLNHGMPCVMLPDMNNRLHHVVRVLEFEDGTRWFARVQMAKSTDATARALQSEVDVMTLVRERTRIPVPRVFSYKIYDEHLIGAAFMLTEFLPGNVAIDLDGGNKVHQGRIPPGHRPSFYTAVVQIQAQFSFLRFPKIGSITQNDDGTYDIGPIPNIGGPFSTAAEFFTAWASHANFPQSADSILEMMGGGRGGAAAGGAGAALAVRVIKSIQDFPRAIQILASRLSPTNNTGPFPLPYPDLYHSNIITDASYNVVGVIDWSACAVPWELVEFPRALPRVMDASRNYDAAWQHVDEDMRVRRKRRGGLDGALSGVLGEERAQTLAYALRCIWSWGSWDFMTRFWRGLGGEREN